MYRRMLWISQAVFVEFPIPLSVFVGPGSDEMGDRRSEQTNVGAEKASKAGAKFPSTIPAHTTPAARDPNLLEESRLLPKAVKMIRRRPTTYAGLRSEPSSRMCS